MVGSMLRNAILGLVFFYLGVSIVSCTKKPVLFKIGRYTLTEQDAKYRQQVALLYYPQEKDSNLGLNQLKKAFTYAEILNLNGHLLTEEILTSEELRIQQSSRDLITLKKIKDIFKDDVASYQKVFILPTYVERVIYYDFFLKSAQIHEDSRKVALEFYNQTKLDPKHFSVVASKLGLKVNNLSLSRANGFQWLNKKTANVENKLIDISQSSLKLLQMRVQLEEEAKNADDREIERWISEIAIITKPGQLVNKIIDHGDVWMIARYIGVFGQTGKHKFEIVKFPKKEYSLWLTEQSDKIKNN